MGTAGGGRSGTMKQLNVGGKLFAMEASSFSLSLSLDSPSPSPTFVDRDPALLSAVLAAIRAPSSAPGFPARDLLDEALFYGLHDQLLAALSPPPLRGFSASLVLHPLSCLRSHSPPPSRRTTTGPSASPTATGSSPTTLPRSTITPPSGPTSTTSPPFGSYPPASPYLGSSSAPGSSTCTISLKADMSPPFSGQTPPTLALARRRSSLLPPALLLMLLIRAHPSWHHLRALTEKTASWQIDPVTLKPTQEIGRQSGSAAKSSVPGRVVHLQELGLVFASSVSGGAFGYFWVHEDVGH
ncbi:hypothetical protein PR202_ga26275 [Eleusine coracana subsp. coracana]|uniref:Uncharacterized protein n=1 Tax=Eleusine coracana subsp. coracana TaxID=191504 RepID=A0AAV5DCB8_ELECO|nr:hypothetical protein PR202_ga26275 [Eleusine coracana subsp. coracana]